MKRAIIIAAAAILLASTIWSGAQMFAQLFGATGTQIPAVAWYKLDGDALDSSGNGRNGTWVGSTAYVAGPFSGTQAASFTGFGISTPEAVCMSGNADAITVAAWVRADITGLGWLVAQSWTNSWVSPYVNFGLATRDKTNVLMRVTNSAKQTTAGLLPLDQFAHICMVGTSSLRTLYVNGTAVLTDSTAASAMQLNPTQALSIARIDPIPSRETFSGAVADLRVFNVALSADNIARIMTGPDVEPIEELQ